MTSAPHHRPRTRTELLANARREARIARGRESFVIRGRLLPIGVPLALAAGALAARRSPRRAALAFGAVVAGVLVATLVEARVEWEAHRRAYDRLRR